MKDWVNVSAKLPVADFEKIEQLCRENDRSRSSLVRIAVSKYLRELDKQEVKQ